MFIKRETSQQNRECVRKSVRPRTHGWLAKRKRRVAARQEFGVPNWPPVSAYRCRLGLGLEDGRSINASRIGSSCKSSRCCPSSDTFSKSSSDRISERASANSGLVFKYTSSLALKHLETRADVRGVGIPATVLSFPAIDTTIALFRMGGRCTSAFGPTRKTGNPFAWRLSGADSRSPFSLSRFPVFPFSRFHHLPTGCQEPDFPVKIRKPLKNPNKTRSISRDVITCNYT